MRLILALLVALLPLSAPAQTLDYNIADQAFPAFRADLNAHLTAIRSSNAGTSAPAITAAYLPWMDLSGAAPVLRYRNAANTGWAAAFRIDPSATVWLGGVQSSSVAITGGTINGTTIGATTPTSATFTTLGSTFQQMTGSANEIRMIASNTASTHNNQSIVNSAGELTFRTLNSGGTIVSNDYVMTKGASGVTQHEFRIANSPALRIASNFNFTIFGSTGAGLLGIDNTTGVLTSWSHLPNANGVRDLGGAGTRWRDIYLVNAPNVSSDARLKVGVSDVAEAECRAADRIQVKRYRLTADPDRWHFGVLAQDVIAAFEAEGLDWRHYAIVTGSEADTYGVAYDELQSLKLACL